MKIEAVTVCCHYSDFLEECVKHNAHHFDRWVVVTTPDDAKTIELCRKRNLTLVTTREFDRDGDGSFNKGRGISLGMNYLSSDAWALHLDADVVLPKRFREMLGVAHLDPECLYGCDRINVRSYEEWKALEPYLDDQHGYHLVTLFPKGYEPGARVIRGKHGYVPIGFFQLWHNRHGVHSGMRYKDYPDSNSDAGHSDIKFSLQWDRRKRVFLPEIVVVHLESGPAQMGANWKGRTTPPFGPAPAKPLVGSAPPRDGQGY